MNKCGGQAERLFVFVYLHTITNTAVFSALLPARPVPPTDRKERQSRLMFSGPAGMKVK